MPIRFLPRATGNRAARLLPALSRITRSPSTAVGCRCRSGPGRCGSRGALEDEGAFGERHGPLTAAIVADGASCVERCVGRIATDETVARRVPRDDVIDASVEVRRRRDPRCSGNAPSRRPGARELGLRQAGRSAAPFGRAGTMGSKTRAGLAAEAQAPSSETGGPDDRRPRVVHDRWIRRSRAGPRGEAELGREVDRAPGSSGSDLRGAPVCSVGARPRGQRDGAVGRHVEVAARTSARASVAATFSATRMPRIPSCSRAAANRRPGRRRHRDAVADDPPPTRACRRRPWSGTYRARALACAGAREQAYGRGADTGPAGGRAQRPALEVRPPGDLLQARTAGAMRVNTARRGSCRIRCRALQPVIEPADPLVPRPISGSGSRRGNQRAARPMIAFSGAWRCCTTDPGCWGN